MRRFRPDRIPSNKLTNLTTDMCEFVVLIFFGILLLCLVLPCLVWSALVWPKRIWLEPHCVMVNCSAYR